MAYPQSQIEGVLYGFQGLALRLLRARPVVFVGSSDEKCFAEVLCALPPSHTAMTIRAEATTETKRIRAPSPDGGWRWPLSDRLLLIYGGLDGSGLFFSRAGEGEARTLAHWSFDPAEVKDAGLWVAVQLHRGSSDRAARWASELRALDAKDA